MSVFTHLLCTVLAMAVGWMLGMATTAKGMSFADGCAAAPGHTMVRVDDRYKCVPLDVARELRK